MSRVTYHRWMRAATATTMTLTLTGRRRCPYCTLAAPSLHPHCTRTAPSLHPHYALATPLATLLATPLATPFTTPPAASPRCLSSRPAARGSPPPRAKGRVNKCRAVRPWRGVQRWRRGQVARQVGLGSRGRELFVHILSFENVVQISRVREEPGRGTRARDAGAG